MPIQNQPGQQQQQQQMSHPHPSVTPTLVDMLKKPSLAPPVHNGTAGLRSVDLSGHVGFDSLPDQLVSKVQQMGFTFNLLCVGETGIGKSTMMESLFNMKLDLSPCSFELGTVELKANTYNNSFSLQNPGMDFSEAEISGNYQSGGPRLPS